MNIDVTKTVSPEISVSARLDRLPPTRFFLGLVARISAGGWFEFYELFMAGYISLGLIRGGLYQATTAGVFDINGFASFLGSFFAGMFIGMMVLGSLADRYGRRTAFTAAILLYSIGTFIAAFQTSALVIDIWRFIAGIGIGVQLITNDAYISELTPNHTRGRYMAFSILMVLTSVPTVAFLSYLLVPQVIMGLEGWRWVMIIGSAGGVVVWLIRRGLPESPRWLEGKGRVREARQIMDTFEERVRAETKSELPPLDMKSAETVRLEKGTWIEMFRGKYLVRTFMLSCFNFLQTFGVYGFGAWVPILLVSKGITVTHSLLYVTVIALATPLGAVGAIMCAERIERKWQLMGCAVAVGVVGILFGLATNPALILLFGCIVTIANNWLIGIFHTYQAELYPTRIRARAVGFVYSWSRVSSVFIGFWVAALLRAFGVDAVFAFIATAMVLIVILIGLLGPRTNGVRLETLSQ